MAGWETEGGIPGWWRGCATDPMTPTLTPGPILVREATGTAAGKGARATGATDGRGPGSGPGAALKDRLPPRMGLARI